MIEEFGNDKEYMQRALALATEAKGKTFPNPAVGAVVVKDGKVIGEGATQQVGGPHAEKVALQNAGNNADGATLYVTLEPCCHYGRTAPCSDSIIKAGIKKVFVSVKDPNPLVAEKGLDILRSKGIEVHCGLYEKEATRLNEDFFFYILNKRAWVTLKLALTLDGRIADCFGGSKWITTSKSRSIVHELRRSHSAIAVGKATLECDDPQLTVRHVPGISPARIVFSPTKDISKELYFYSHAHETRSIIVVPEKNRSIDKNEQGIEIWRTGETDRVQSIKAFLKMAYDQQLPSIFIEGGQRVASQFLEAELVNRVYLFYGNKIVGKGRDGIEFESSPPINQCITLINRESQLLGDDILVTGYPVRVEE